MYGCCIFDHFFASGANVNVPHTQGEETRDAILNVMGPVQGHETIEHPGEAVADCFLAPQSRCSLATQLLFFFR